MFRGVEPVEARSFCSAKGPKWTICDDRGLLQRPVGVSLHVLRRKRDRWPPKYGGSEP